MKLQSDTELKQWIQPDKLEAIILLNYGAINRVVEYAKDLEDEKQKAELRQSWKYFKGRIDYYEGLRK